MPTTSYFHPKQRDDGKWVVEIIVDEGPRTEKVFDTEAEGMKFIREQTARRKK